MNEWMDEVAGKLVALVAAMTAVVVAIRGAVHLVSRMQHFLDDWFGEEARDGKPASPGVMERLERLERGVTQVQETQADGTD